MAEPDRRQEQLTLGFPAARLASDTCSPTLAEARARIAGVRPAAYARTRNALDGAVSGLSPYITHGFVTLTEVLAGVVARHAIGAQHKFVYELGWRAYFRHVWQQRGEGILRSLHEGPLPDDTYARELPADIREGRTGVAVVDEAVHALYGRGTLHNHARMWLASYVVHVRKVHWRVAADWMYGHLLDGDLASSHLSWQWVAGTASYKPYVFNADNVARFAPASWHSPGSVIDTSYEELDRMARRRMHPAASRVDSQTEGDRDADPQSRRGVEPICRAEPPEDLGLKAPAAAAVEGRDVWLVHPWSLGELPAALPAGTRVIGVFLDDFHRDFPWSERRWRFVGGRMAEITATRWHADAATLGAVLKGARTVRSAAEPHLAAWWPRLAECESAPALFPPVTRRCESFSQWWAIVSRGLDSASDLLALNDPPE
jgi:deoxyribodipyrimidine photo-lyase